MNTTVARIVEIMFQDTEITDEVQALKEEVMNNCQERYQDLVGRGLSEDEAIAAVVDSLKGMEEVIAQYPKKHGAQFAEDDEDTDKDLVFDPRQVRRVKVLLTSDDVNIEEAGDELVHVYYDKEDMPNLVVEMSGDTLKIERDNKAEVKYEKPADAPVDQQEWNSFSDFMNGIKKMLNNVHVNMQYGGGGEVTIALPQEYCIALDIHTTSGDVDIDEVALSEVNLESTSGDVGMVLVDTVKPREIRVKTASGDVDITAETPALTIQTVSGDVEYDGDCPSIYVTTVSGDAQINGEMNSVNLKTVSGDIDLRVEGASLREVNCNTTSGDLQIHLPASLRGQVGVRMQTVSGDKHNRYGESLGSPIAWVNARSVSGDVTLC